MRIIAGNKKGKKLFGFEGQDVRPTSDKAREAIFAILGNINGYSFADICCGSGAMGLEAESRGAAAIMVDNSAQSVMLAKKNAKCLDSHSQIIKADALSFLKTTSLKFDIIFSDPPYAIDLCGDMVKIIVERDLLKRGGVFIYERDISQDFSYKNLLKYDERKYGKGVFSFYKAVENE